MLFDDSMVRLDAPATDPDTAVRLAGSLLVDAGAATSAYVEAMVTALHDLGPYIVLAPGVAMPHARPGAGGLRPAISFVRLAEPLAFGHPANDPVRLVIALVGPDDHGHLDLLRAVANALSDPADSLTLLETRDPRRIVEVFTG